MNLSTGLERYLRFHRSEGSSAHTLSWHGLSIRQFVAYLAANAHSGDTDDLAAEDLRGYIDDLRDQGLSPASVATKVRSIKAWGKWLLTEEYLARDPFAKVKRPKVDDIPKAIFTPEEVVRLLSRCDRRRLTGARDYALILLLLSTGLRAGEVLAIQESDIDAEKNLITVRRGKGGKFRVVPLSRPVEKALFRYLEHPQRPRHGRVPQVFLSRFGNPLTLDGLERTLQVRGEAVGVHANPHKFRHTAAVEYLRQGGRLETLRVMLGHSSLMMTLHYARLAGVDLVSAHEQADPLRSLKTRL